ncbi:MAG: hypothetical protein H3C57_08465 [Gammaproteobacteria bacterium]|nr:hypothetical protein [Gammaproteobacteria bacterium]
MRMLLILGLAALLLLALAFQLGRWRAGHDIPAARALQQELEGRVSALAEENHQLRQAAVRLETDALVDREACLQVESQLSGLQDRLLEQQEELAFYRGIVGGAGRGKLRVREFSREALADGSSRIRFTLASIEQLQAPVRGRLQLRIEGRRAGRFASLDADSPELGAKALPRDFDFRYFQAVSAELRLPDDFAPERIVIRLMPVTAGVGASVESFPWQPAPPEQSPPAG